MQIPGLNDFVIESSRCFGAGLKCCEEDNVELWSTVIVSVVRQIGFDATPQPGNLRLITQPLLILSFLFSEMEIKNTSLTMLLSW